MKNEEKYPVDISTGQNKAAKKEIISDPMGSYTGRTPEPEEKPVQDADDL